MARYAASNGKVIDTSKMEDVLDLSYDGTYGDVDSSLFRTPKSHNWYIVSESSWSGAEAVSLAEATKLVLEEIEEENVRSDYPELIPYIDEVMDL